MKRLFLLLFFAGMLNDVCAQLLPPNQPEQDACDALVLCGNTFTSSFSYQGEGTITDLVSCLCDSLGAPAGEQNSMWMRLNVVTGGIIVFTITPLSPQDDYDFAVVDITGKTCNTFTSADVVRCNFNNNWPGSNVNGVVGLSTSATLPKAGAGATGNSFQQAINANTGDSYLIMINNYGNYQTGGQSQGFTIDFTGTTATFNGTPPQIKSLIPSCNNATQITLELNQNILCTSIEPSGSDFSVPGGSIAGVSGINCTGTNGYTDKIVINFATQLPPGTYTLNVQVGTDGNSLLNPCNIPLAVPSSISFVVDPYIAPAYETVLQPACQDIRIKLNKRVRCDSIAADGSDFTISGPQSAAVTGAYGTGCDTANFTDTVVLILQSPLITDGTYTIISNTGTDKNTLMDSCGLEQNVGDAIQFSLNSYDGQLKAFNDTVLCDAGYFTLTAVNTSALPPQTVSCGLPATCSGNVFSAFVGEKDTATDANSPFFGSVSDQRVQYLYLANELRNSGLKPGLITQLQWEVTQQLSSQPYNNLNIKIGCSGLMSFAQDFATGLQNAYSASSYTVVPGWNTFPLAMPFVWDGASNIVVEVCYDNILGTANDEVAHGITSFTSVIRKSSGTLPGCVISSGTPAPFRNIRPNLRFSICEPPAGTAQYMWSPGNFLSDSSVQSPLAYVGDAITYHVTVVDKYGCAHRDSSSLTLSVRNFDVFPQDTTICYGKEIALQAYGGTGYMWLASDPASLSCTDCAKTIVSPRETSVYQVVINDSHNCADTLQSVVRINPLPPVDILMGDTIVKFGTVIELEGAGAFTYSWSPVEYFDDPNLEIVRGTIKKPGIIYLTGIDQNGCLNIDSIKIGVDYTDAVYIPSAFTPNGDGKNDIFKVGSISFQRLMEFRIFNRWGQQVFYSIDPRDGWDGSFNGVPQDQGVYNYIIRIAYPDGKMESYKGDVTLIK